MADADTEDQPPPGEVIERAVPLGHGQRVVVGQDKDMGLEPDAFGQRGEVTE